MADLRLHRAQCTPGGLALAGGAEHGREATSLSGVSGLRRRTVSLDELDGRRTVVRLLISATQRTRLPLGARRVHTGSLSVGRRTQAANYGVDHVAISLSVLKTTERKHSYALTDECPIGLF